MTQIIPQHGNGHRTQNLASLEPLGAIDRLVRDFWRMDPFRGVGMLRSVTDTMEGFQPTFDLKERKEDYVMRADVPGVREKELEISIHGNRLQISGSREAEKEEKTETIYTSERLHGSFMRIFTLPEDAVIDQIRADLKDGVLSVIIPKRAESQTKRVPIKS